ncbi:MAG: hypothetical protein U0840_12715 [Gemmataceae bacterium]
MTCRFLLAWWCSAILLAGTYAWTGLAWHDRLVATEEATRALAEERQALVRAASDRLRLARADDDNLAALARYAQLRARLDGLVAQWSARAVQQIDARTATHVREQTDQLRAWAQAHPMWNISAGALERQADRCAAAWAETAGRFHCTARRDLEQLAQRPTMDPLLFQREAPPLLAGLLADLDASPPLDLAALKLDLLVDRAIQALREHVYQELIPGERPRGMIDRALPRLLDEHKKPTDPDDLRRLRETLTRHGDELLAGSRPLLRQMLAGPLNQLRTRLLDALRGKLPASDTDLHARVEQASLRQRDALAVALETGIEQELRQVVARGHPGVSPRVLVLLIAMEGLDRQADLVPSLREAIRLLEAKVGPTVVLAVSDREEKRWMPGAALPIPARAHCPPRRFGEALQRGLDRRAAWSRATTEKGGLPTFIVWPCVTNPNDLYDLRAPTVDVPEGAPIHFFWVGAPREGRSNWLRANFGEAGYSALPTDEIARLGEQMTDRLRDWKRPTRPRGDADGR